VNDRVRRLREASVAARPCLSPERAILLTQFYREHANGLPAPLLRARAFRHLCEHKTIRIGEDELIVGERGPAPAAVPTYPELTCHSLEDLRILDSREKTRYAVSGECLRAYEDEIIPFWRGRSMRDRIFAAMTPEWRRAYEAGIFTEFMEQRAPGHTVADGKIYARGLRDFQREIAASLAGLDRTRDPLAAVKTAQLQAMSEAAEAAIVFARRHAALARQMAASEPRAARRAELQRIAEVCERVPAEAPRDFHEALQMYWFCHLGVITELNGWDAFNPGHLDQHLAPFYARGLEDGSLTRESAQELLECWWIKFNDHPAPPKVGVTAEESGTYGDFTNINLGGLTRDGRDGVSEVSYLLLEVIDEVHTIQPGSNVQIARGTPERFLREACRVIRNGYGFPAVFNADAVVAELTRQGKSLEDAREGGTSGCVETGAFGKEAYILTGYFNLTKILELTLHDGVEPRSGARLGPRTGDPRGFASFDDLFAAWSRQVRHFADLKIAGNDVIERLYADEMPAPFLSLLIDDCVANGRDYNAGGARYNTSYVQGVGIGSLTDSLSAIRRHVYETRSTSMDELLAALADDFAGREALRLRLANRTPRYGNDDDAADALMRACFDVFFDTIEGRPNARGGSHHINMLPTTCHIYFGSVTGATPDGRHARKPLSEGISPVQGADRCGPTAVLKSAGKMDHVRTGGTLLNQKFSRSLLEGEEGLARLAQLVRGYFRMGGHHVQFNVVGADTLRAAQERPQEHRDLIVRVAGYSDYFVDLGRTLQDEIISRTEHQRV